MQLVYLFDAQLFKAHDVLFFIKMKTIYENFLLKHFSNVFTISKHENSPYTAVIVDPRFDQLFCAVCRNFMSILGKHGWNLKVYTLAQFENQVAKLLPGADFQQIDTKYLDKDNGTNMSISSYNNIMMDANFWQSIPSEHILIFQTDCIMYRMFNDAFLQCDYVGANWYNPADVDILAGGINGGCSYRKKQVMLDCLRYVSWEMIARVRANQIKQHGSPAVNVGAEVSKRNEDVFFTHACEILQMVLPPPEVRPLFAVEADFHEQTCFYHGWNKDYQRNPQIIANLLSTTLCSAGLNSA